MDPGMLLGRVHRRRSDWTRRRATSALCHPSTSGANSANEVRSRATVRPSTNQLEEPTVKIPTITADALRRDDLPLLIQLAQPMPQYAGDDQPTSAKWGTHVPTGPGNNHDDINVDYSFD